MLGYRYHLLAFALCQTNRPDEGSGERETGSDTAEAVDGSGDAELSIAVECDTHQERNDAGPNICLAHILPRVEAQQTTHKYQFDHTGRCVRQDKEHEQRGGRIALAEKHIAQRQAEHHQYGYLNLEPFDAARGIDEVVDALKEVGDALPASLRETGEGGVAACQSARMLKRKYIDKEED